jgi:hypothetical protein
MAKRIKIKLCKVCGKQLNQFKTTDIVCSYICQLKYIESKECEREHKKIALQVKNDEVSKGYPKILQNLINTIVRLIDKGHSCITSGSFDCQFHAGHYVSVGANKTIRYNLLNIFAQSEQDNWHKGGKGSNYGIRLKEVFGTSVRDEIEGLTAKYPRIGLRDSDYLEKILICRRIIKELKEADRVYSTDERILLRREFNEQIGIYK